MAPLSRKDAIADPAAALEAEGSVLGAARLARKLWELGAPAGPMTQMGPLSTADPSKLDEMRPALAMSLAAISAEAGVTDRALLWLDRALRGAPDPFAKSGYAGLLDGAAPFRPDLAQQTAGLLPLTAAWHRSLGQFAQMITDGHPRLCIVGNAPLLAGSGKGAEIDDHDIVLRFNAFRTGAEHHRDVGQRTDIWVRTAGMAANWRRDGLACRLVAIAGSPAYWRSPHGLAVAIDAHRSGLPHDTIDPLTFFDITTQLGHKPSNGLAVLGWIRSIRGSLKDVTVLGFALDDQPVAETRRYFTETRRLTPPPHDWPAERALLDTWLGEVR